jgi:hypothetical protein
LFADEYSTAVWPTNVVLSSTRSVDCELLIQKRERGKGKRRKEKGGKAD